MTEKNRKYYQSSSFKMAALFALLLSFAGVILGYFIYAYSNGEIISDSQVAISTATYNQILLLGAISICLLLCVALISFGLSIFVVRRINLISNTAKRIMYTGDLSKRINIDHRWDDLSDLAFVLNEMLEKIEKLMAGIKQVSDNIAHDLRTPLTRLRNKLEGLSISENNSSEFEKMINEADNLLNTFNALLRISNIEKGKRHNQFLGINLKNLLSDVIELYEPLAHEKNIQLNFKLADVNFYCDKDLLFQAFANILDNSVKFTKNGGLIEIELSENKIITIKDNGNGISNEEKEKVFDRFYRSDASRNTSGNGLGLSLVKAVIDMHKAKIELADNVPSGLIVKVILN